MRAARIVNRINLRSRAKAARYLINQQQRLTEGAINLFNSGFQAALQQQEVSHHTTQELSPPPPAETAHSNGLHSAADGSTSGGSLSSVVTGEHL